MKVLIPARHGKLFAVPATSIEVGSSGASKILCDRYRRYLKTRDFAWMVKLQAQLFHARDLPCRLQVAHAICNEAWSYEQSQTTPDVTHIIALCNDMLSLLASHPEAVDMETIWYPRQLALVPLISQAMREPGFDMRRLDRAGLVLLEKNEEVNHTVPASQLSDVAQQLQQDDENKANNDEGDDDGELSPNDVATAYASTTKWRVKQDGEGQASKHAFRLEPYNASSGAFEAAVDNVQLEMALETATRRQRQNRIKRARKQSAKQRQRSSETQQVREVQGGQEGLEAEPGSVSDSFASGAEGVQNC